MAEEAGEVVSCPQCSTEVKQKSMIPVLGPDSKGHRYLCRECARALIPADDGDAADQPDAVPTGGDGQQQD